MNTEIYGLRDLEKDYGPRFSLQIEELTINQGDVYAIIGPSGAGKSTLLRLLNFLEQPSKGLIRFLGREIRTGELAPLSLRRQVTTVFQRPILLNRSVKANIAYGLKLRGMGDTDQRVMASIEAMGLSSLAHQPARRLSGGEAQRVALARATLLKTKALLLDEPTANLDPYNVSLIEKTIKRLNQEQSATVVLVTHNLFQARRLAQKAALLIDGKLIHAGDIDEFFENPSHSLVKSFIHGEMVY